MINRKQYAVNKLSPIRSEIICPSCGTRFVKKTYQQTFCKSKSGTECKDKYWNTVIPTKRNNTSRISPASYQWSMYRDEYIDDDPSWDAHKDSF